MRRAPGGGGMMNTPSAEGRRGHPAGGFAVLAVAALSFGIAAAATIHGSVSMAMPWMRMPGQSWPEVAAGFLGMWVAMMVAMMLPSLLPMLYRYRRALSGVGELRLGLLTTLMALGYFLVWSALGVAVFPAGVALAGIRMRVPALARAIPFAVAMLLLMAGLLQFTAWKARHLACCRQGPGHGQAVAAEARAAWRHGLRCGLHCSLCCAGPTLVLLGLGVMDLRAMAMVMVVITTERLAPAAERAARAIGTLAVGAGLVLLVVLSTGGSTAAETSRQYRWSHFPGAAHPAVFHQVRGSRRPTQSNPHLPSPDTAPASGPG
jgi:predicted metal-binding membrane protein